jgi:hypothetical protein
VTVTTYDPADIPPNPDPERSRFAVSHSRTGIESHPNTVLAASCEHLTSERAQEAEHHAPAQVRIQLKRVALTTEGAHVVVPLRQPELLVTPNRKPQRPSRFSKFSGTAAEELDSFFLGGDAWRESHDDAIYEAARATCAVHDIQGEALRRLNAATIRALVARAGYVNDSWEVPF